MHRPQCVGGAADFFEDYKRLAPHFEGLEGDYVEDLAKLREDGVEGLLEVILLDLLVQVVDVDGVVRTVVHPCFFWLIISSERTT